MSLAAGLVPVKPRPKIQAKMTISKTAPYLICFFTWELILDTYRGLGYAQFGWSIFLNRWWLLKPCDKRFQPREALVMAFSVIVKSSRKLI